VATATRNLTVLNLMGLHVRPITTIVLLLKKHGAKASIHVAGEDVACDSMALMIAADKFPQGTRQGAYVRRLDQPQQVLPSRSIPAAPHRPDHGFH
jgi:hypothetical protein